MMKKLDQRGVASFEFILVAFPMFITMFVIFDLARYALTLQSLKALANAEARAFMVCYGQQFTSQPIGSAEACTGDLVSDKTLFVGTPTGSVTPAYNAMSGTATATISVEQPGFAMMVPMMWPSSFEAKFSTSIPYVHF
jgi:Flp pilus assembly protein TadG